MELKEFKEGIAFLAKSTNQRRAEPDPFMLQVGKDQKISLVSGNESGTYIWRTGLNADCQPMRIGLPSKAVVQTAKNLKGKFSVSLNVSETSVSILTDQGGSLKVPTQFETPEIKRPASGLNLGSMLVNPAGLGARILAAAEPEIGWDYVQMDKNGLIATNERKLFKVRTSGIGWNTPHAHRASFWDGLSGATTDGELSFLADGVHVVSGKYEASTWILEPRNVPDITTYYYPEGRAYENRAVMDRKVLIGSLKSLDSIIYMSINGGMVNLVDNKGQQVGLTAKYTRGSKTVAFGSKMMMSMVSSMDGKEVILEWKDDTRSPILITDAGEQSQLFLLAPVLPRAT